MAGKGNYTPPIPTIIQVQDAKDLDRIPSVLRKDVWAKFVDPREGVGKCYCCGEEILQSNFECGHIQSKSRGGKISLDNLRPVSRACNGSMAAENMAVFAKQCGYHDSPILKEIDDEKKATKHIFMDAKVPEMRGRLAEALGQQNSILIEREFIAAMKLARSWGVTNFNKMLRSAAWEGHIAAMELAKSWGADNFDDALTYAAIGGHITAMELAKSWDAKGFDALFQYAKIVGRPAAMEFLKSTIAM